MANNEMERVELMAELDELVESGLLVRFTNREGLPAWGFPVEHPESHDWGQPKLDEWCMTNEGPIVTLRWYCSIPGCTERIYTDHRVEF